MLFAEAGLSPAEISSLFVIWSVTSFTLEVPSGLWADIFSRRRLLMVAPAMTAAGFALWTFVPGYVSFALGFVLWGAGGAMRSGTLQALVYEELARVGASGSYARIIGRSEAIGTTAAMAATGLTAPVLAAGGYVAVGSASVAACLLGVVAGWSLPESRGRPERTRTYVAVLRDGLAEVRAVPQIRRCLILSAVLMGTSALDEYIPLLAAATGVGTPAVPLLVLLVSAGTALGGWFAGRGTRRLAPILAIAAGCLAAGAASGRPSGFVLVAAAFGIFQWAMAAADARLQDRLSDSTRATVTSMAGFGAEVVAVLIYAAYALGSTWAEPWLIFTVAAVPFLVIALVLGRVRE